MREVRNLGRTEASSGAYFRRSTVGTLWCPDAIFMLSVIRVLRTRSTWNVVSVSTWETSSIVGSSKYAANRSGNYEISSAERAEMELTLKLLFMSLASVQNTRLPLG